MPCKPLVLVRIALLAAPAMLTGCVSPQRPGPDRDGGIGGTGTYVECGERLNATQAGLVTAASFRT